MSHLSTRRYERAWYRRWFKRTYRIRRANLIERMGGQCKLCGRTDSLEFGHTARRDWVPAKLNRLQRLKRYEADWKDGRCQLECRQCNATKERGARQWHDGADGL